MAATSTAISVTTSVTSIVAADVDRHSVILFNNGSNTIFLGSSESGNALTTSNGLPLLPNQTYQEDNSGTKIFTGAIQGIVAAATEEMRVWSRTIGST